MKLVNKLNKSIEIKLIENKNVYFNQRNNSKINFEKFSHRESLQYVRNSSL
jgi:hypothetical protein